MGQRAVLVKESLLTHNCPGHAWQYKHMRVGMYIVNEKGKYKNSVKKYGVNERFYCYTIS